MDELVLKRVEFSTFPGTCALGVTIQISEFFANYTTRNKVKWLWVSFNFIRWQLAFRFPLKRYGVRGVA